jgi:cytochrome c553
MKKLLFIVLSIVAVGLSCGRVSSANTINAAAFTGACRKLPSPSAPNFTKRFNEFVTQLCYQKQQWEHDANRRTSQNIHDTLVKIWYSPLLLKWMTVQNRQGPVPNGAIAIKEEYSSETSPIQFWSGMVKDSSLWWDGWYWSVVGTESSGAAPAALSTTNGCAEPQFSLNGPTSVNCIGCHASAVSNVPGAGTFSAPTFLASNQSPAGAAGSMPADAQLPAFATRLQAQADPDPASGFTGRLPSSIFANVRMLPAATIPCMVPESLDQVTSKPASKGGPSLFVTSNQCASCHDATNNAPMPTHMLYTEPGSSTPVNLSTYGEWRYSMMGLSGRDPVFFAQLDTESTVHSKLKGKRNAPAFIQDTCLSCHGVMGQRQFHLDKGNAPTTLFTRKLLNDANSRYGALARDGVSCAVCHHISDDDGNLDDPSTYTGRFPVGPADVVYGPYPSGGSDVKVGDDVIPRPMKNSVGIVPIFGAQIGQAKLCASCHTIVLPVYDAKGKQVIEHGVPKTEFEQTTYLEWLNSSFVNQPCQDCHMPDNFKGAKLEFQVANIQDSTFPRIPEIGIQTSLPADQLILQSRTFYARHQLLGINLFALEMFDQFRTDLGLYKEDGFLPSDLASTVLGQKNAVEGAVLQAQSMTAGVTFDSATKNGGQLLADVRVQNLAGHNLPSGVSFRRAFLDFQVLDGSGNVLLESGGTNSDGVIIDTAGNPLPTEFFSPPQQTFQPHFWTGNPITNDQQVEIYEEMVRDPQGQLTTSFLSLDDKVKDNRIQPQGRSSTGPNADITVSVGTGADPSYQGGCGCSVVRYQLPLMGGLTSAAKVQATLYYQSIPPYYLRQRAEDGHGPDTARLVKFTNELDVNKYTEISNWKLKVTSSGPVDIQ